MEERGQGEVEYQIPRNCNVRWNARNCDADRKGRWEKRRLLDRTSGGNGLCGVFAGQKQGDDKPEDWKKRYNCQSAA